MAGPSPRTPSLWLVIVPGLALAVLAGRAVMTEAERAETATRAQGRQVAARLARSVDGLVTDFRQGLPSTDAAVDIADALERTDFLEERWIVSRDGRQLEERRSAAAPSRTESALVEDALATAEGLDEGGDDARAAPALLAGTAAAVEAPSSRVTLLLRAAEIGLAQGTTRRAGDDLGEAFQDIARLPAEEEVVALTRGLGLALELHAADAEAITRGRWLENACERLASDPWGLDAETRDGLLDVLERTLRPAERERLGQTRRHWAAVRTFAAADPPPAARVEADDGELQLLVFGEVRLQRGGETVDAMVGGAIPDATVRTRLEREADALVAEPGVLAVQLIGPDGLPLLARGDQGEKPGSVRENVPLAAPLDGWSVEAITLAPAGFSALVVALAAAALLTTIALVFGAVSLQRTAQAQARLAEDRKRFLDHVAHEIRTPTTALLTLSEQLASGTVRAEREELYREHLLTEARRLAELVDDTLDLTRLEAGRLAFRREPADLNEVVASALEASRARGRTRPDGPPQFDVSLPEGPVAAHVDRTAVGRTVRNLLDNAWQHGGGDAPVEITLASADGVATIRVRDLGRGIAAEHLTHLFDRFYRVPGATHEGKGVGLGLSLCREVARAHGGDITVESREGAGTTFTLTVPLEEPHAG